MANNRTIEPDELAKVHRRLRRMFDLIYLAIALIILLGGAIAWVATRNPDWIFGGLFYAALLLVALFFNHFVLLRLGPDPFKTQQRLMKLDQKYARRVRSVLRWNGLLLVIASLLSFLIALGSEKSQFSPFVDLLLVSAICTVGFIAGALMMWWGWKKKGKNSSSKEMDTMDESMP